MELNNHSGRRQRSSPLPTVSIVSMIIDSSVLIIIIIIIMAIVIVTLITNISIVCIVFIISRTLRQAAAKSNNQTYRS